MIKVNDLVEFSEADYPDEAGLVYRVLEVNEERAIIQLENTNLPIPPQSVAKLCDLAVVNH